MIGGPSLAYPSMAEWINSAVLPPPEDPIVLDEQIQSSGLAELYNPPSDINFSGSLSDALQAGKLKKHWLLVNIQDSTEFSSQILNRDAWRHETVKEVIKSAFVFWQRDKSTSAGASFVANYQIKECPIVCIIDPRTGRKVKVWTIDKFKGPFVVTDLLMDFIGANSMDQPRPRPRLDDTHVHVDDTHATHVDVTTHFTSAAAEVPLQMPVEFMNASPEEQLKLAIRTLNGVKHQISFKSSSRLSVIQQWVSATEQLTVGEFQVRLSHPPQTLNFDTNETLENANVRGALLVVVLT